MSYRYMRVMIFFDLPTISKEDLRQYRRFRNFLIKEGFIMMQESVYSKLVLNQINVKAVVDRVKKNKPNDGTIQLLAITEKQFNSMEFILGEKISEVIDTDEKVLII